MLRRGIALHGLSAANNNRYFVDLHVKTIEQLLSGCVTVKVDICVRLSVAGEKLAQAQCISRVTRPQNNYVTHVSRNKRQAPMDESAHEDTAEFGIFRNERTQGIRGHLKELS